MDLNKHGCDSHYAGGYREMKPSDGCSVCRQLVGSPLVSQTGNASICFKSSMEAWAAKAHLLRRTIIFRIKQFVLSLSQQNLDDADDRQKRQKADREAPKRFGICAQEMTVAGQYAEQSRNCEYGKP